MPQILRIAYVPLTDYLLYFLSMLVTNNIFEVVITRLIHLGDQVCNLLRPGSYITREVVWVARRMFRYRSEPESYSLTYQAMPKDTSFGSTVWISGFPTLLISKAARIEATFSQTESKPIVFPGLCVGCSEYRTKMWRNGTPRTRYVDHVRMRRRLDPAR